MPAFAGRTLPGTYPHDAQLNCRVGGGGSEHYRTIEALEFSIDPQKKIIPMRDMLHRKRNIGSYDDYGFSRLSTFRPWKLAANEVEC
jgi:hypothetical protein